MLIQSTARLTKIFAIGLLMSLPAASHAQETFRSADDYYEDASRRISDGDTPGGIIQLRNALQAEDGHVPSMLALGKALLITGQPTEAIIILNDALLLGVEAGQVFPTLADAYLSAGEYGELLRTLTPADVPRSLRAEVYAARAQAFLAQGRNADGGKMLTEAMALDPQNFRAQLAQATYHLQRDELREALSVSQTLIERAPNDTRSWSSHASALHALGRLDDAADAYSAAIREEGRNTDARIALIDLLMETRQDAAAQPHVDYMRETYPTEPRAAYYSALLAAREGDADKEREELTLASSLFTAVTAEQMRGNPQLLMLAALSNYGANAYESAVKYVDDYLQLRPEDAGARRLKASTLLALGDASNAIRTLLPQYQRNPRDIATATLLASAYSQEGNYRRAEELLLSMAEAGASNDAIEQQLAFTRLNAGSLDAGISDLERLRERNPAQADLSIQLAVAYLRDNRPEQALSIIVEMPSELAQSPAVQNLRAVALSRTGDLVAAEAIWQNLLNVSSNALEIMLNLATTYIKTNRYDEANAMLARARSEYPESARALSISARLKLRQNLPDDALRDAEQALTLAPDNDDAAWQLIRALLALNKPDEAQEVARKYAARNADSLSAGAILGRTFELVGQPLQARLVYTQMGRKPELSANELFGVADFQRNAGAPESAELSLTFALERNARFRAARLELASVQLQLEKYAAAEKTATEQLAQTPEDSLAWLQVGDARLAQGKYSTAAEAYEKSIAGGRASLGSIGVYRAKLALQQPGAAERALRRGLQLTDGDARVRAALTDLLIAQGRWEESEDELSALLELVPESTLHFNNRAFVRQQLGRLEDAEKDARRALELNPDYASANDTLGWILAEANRPKEALPFLREATARMGTNNSVRFHLARVLADLERPSEALTELYHVLETADEFPERIAATELRDRLEKR